MLTNLKRYKLSLNSLVKCSPCVRVRHFATTDNDDDDEETAKPVLIFSFLNVFVNHSKLLQSSYSAYHKIAKTTNEFKFALDSSREKVTISGFTSLGKINEDGDELIVNHELDSVEKEKFKEILFQQISINIKDYVILPEAADFISSLKSDGYAMGLCTRLDQRTLLHMLKAMRIDSCFASVLGEGVIPVKKPDPG